MAYRPAEALGLPEGDCAELERLTRASSVRAGLVLWARIILLAPNGCRTLRTPPGCHARFVGGSPDSGQVGRFGAGPLAG